MQNTNRTIFFGLIVIALTYVGGYFTGFIFALPKNINFTIGVTPELNYMMDKMQNYTVQNPCCFPADCEQAKDNPANCTCQYLVDCYEKGLYAKVD